MKIRLLIPCYRDFSPYDLPNEFSNLQALDMSKIGFMQELIDSIERLNKGTKNIVMKILLRITVRKIHLRLLNEHTFFLMIKIMKKLMSTVKEYLIQSRKTVRHIL